MTTILELLSTYIFEPEAFWEEDVYFHRRNREKINRSRAGLKLRSQQDVADLLLPRLRARAEAQAKSLFVISNGASGCHFFGSVLASSRLYHLIGEVYFPTEFAEAAAAASDPMDAHMIMDSVSAIHLRNMKLLSKNTIPVNVMHLRPDSPLDEIREYLPNGKQAVLIRNPYDIAISRSFRKQDYREASNPSLDDTRYAKMQANGVRRFFATAANTQWDAVVRYENLRNNPLQVARDTLWTVGFPAWNLRYARASIDNHNTEPRPDVPTEIAQEFYTVLTDTATAWHYEPPADLRFGDLTGDRHWVPMQKELLTPQVYRHVRDTQTLLVVPSLDPFDPRASLEQIGPEERSETWQMYFWTFCWLHLMSELEEDGEALLLDWLGRALDLSAEYCLDPEAAPKRFWDDHATAYRAGTLLYFIHKYIDSDVVRSRYASFGSIFSEHARILAEFIDSPRWEGNNHGVFHALAYVNLYLNCEYVTAASERPQRGLDKGLKHLNKTLSAIIDPETGISREQCLHYHLWTISLLEEVDDFLRRTGVNIGFDVNELIEKMLAVGQLLMVGAESMPAIGDTAYRSGYKQSFIRNKTASYFGRELRTVQEMNLARTEGRFTTVFGADREFCAVRLDADTPERASLMMMTSWHERVSHGHYDALSVWYTRAGAPLLIDSGGPFNYGAPERFQYFIQPQAHNVVMIDRKAYQGTAAVIKHAGDDSGQLVHAHIPDNFGMSHHRITLLLDSEELLILDRLTATDGASHEIDALFHFPPGAEVMAEVTDGVHRITIDQADDETGEYVHHNRMFMASQAATEMTLSLTKGAENAAFPGWVTTGQGKMLDAPVLIAHSQGQTLGFASVVEGNRAIAAVTIEAQPGPTLRIDYQDGSSRALDIESVFQASAEDISVQALFGITQSEGAVL